MGTKRNCQLNKLLFKYLWTCNSKKRANNKTLDKTVNIKKLPTFERETIGIFWI